MGHILDDWFLEIITGSWRLEQVPGGYLLVPGGYNRLLEVLTGSLSIYPVPGCYNQLLEVMKQFLENYNRFLEVITSFWRL